MTDTATIHCEDEFTLCESVDGWSLHAPGSTDEEIATGEAPPLASGEWGEERVIPEWGYRTARLQQSIENLRSHDFSSPCSGYRQEIYLDPEESKVYVFACVGSGYPIRAHHNIDVHLVDIPADAIGDSVADALLNHLDTIQAFVDLFKGTKWDGHNLVGQWEEWDEPYALNIEPDEIHCAWDPADWLDPSCEGWEDWAQEAGIDPERTDAKGIKIVADHLIACAESEGYVLKDPTDYLEDRAQEWVQEETS